MAFVSLWKTLKSCKVTSPGGFINLEKLILAVGVAFLESSLFTTYNFNRRMLPGDDHDDGDENEAPPFQISLSALLETLQIFGLNETKERWSTHETNYGFSGGSFGRGGPTAAFENRAYGAKGLCRLKYGAVGDPLCIVLEEAGVTTTCELATYEPEYLDEIPLQKDAISQKIIMRASWLYDAIAELSSTSPTRLTFASSPNAPHFVLSASGPLGSASVEFTKDTQLLETFQVPHRVVNTYKYSLIKAASRAMEIATKVSIRTDEQGVLSLQFMIEVESGGCSFVDFRFVPFLPEDGEEEEEGESGYQEESE